MFHSSYYRKPSDIFTPTVQTCYDFTYEKFRKGPAKWIHSYQKRKAILSANGVICISESTRKDLHRYYPEVNPEKTCTIHLGVSNDFNVIRKQNLYNLVSKFKIPEKPFSIFVGTRDYYKNFYLTIDAVSLYNDNHILVIVGGSAINKNHYEYLNRKLKGRWIYISKVSNQMLNILYNCAYSLLYPSSYEGFGIPIIEAMAAGCPVIAFKSSSIPEVAGDAGILIENLEALFIAESLKNLENRAYRKDISMKGIENSKRFSWERCYKKTINFYKKILNR